MSSRNNAVIDLSATVIIRQNVPAVFRYISNLSLDKTWRKEIIRTIVKGPFFGLNSIAVEHACLSKKVADHQTSFVCTTYTANRLIAYESLPENRYWQQAIRQVEQTLNGHTRLVYTLRFDASLVTYALGFWLPRFLVTYYTKTTMKKYLRNVKHILEAPAVTGAGLQTQAVRSVQ